MAGWEVGAGGSEVRVEGRGSVFVSLIVSSVVLASSVVDMVVLEVAVVVVVVSVISTACTFDGISVAGVVAVGC